MFYTFSQNNSGGYFVEDLKNGVCEYVIIEARSEEQADGIFSRIGDKADGFYEYCTCCGRRWGGSDEPTEQPTIHGRLLTEQTKGYRDKAFVHYMSGEFKLVES